MKKIKVVFCNYFEQKFYEGLRIDGMKKAAAIKETKARFKAYDEGKEIIFVK
jgi:hypothetical protein